MSDLRIVALDVGSSSVRAVAYDEHGVPEPGEAHLATAQPDPDELVAACRAVLAQVGPGDAVAISSFWHSLVAVDAHDRPLTPVLTWRDLAGAPAALPADDDYHRRTGCFAHPAYWPAKILRLRSEGVRATRFLSFGDYLLLHLAGEARSSISTASGTGLYDPNRLDWDDETLARIGVERSQLPPVSDEPVAGVYPALGDGACSNAGAGCSTRDRAAVMVGTSAAARVLYGAESAAARPGLFLYRLDAQRFCEGGALSDGGNLHSWLVHTLRDVADDELAGRPPAGHGLVFNAFLGGERSLGWNPDRRGELRGLSFATSALDILQAALENVCYQLAAVLDSLGGIASVVATGGALRANPAWTQILADVLGRSLELSAVSEGSARGAALLALERLGSPVPAAPVAGTVEPRPGRFEVHLAARAEQRETMLEETT